MPVIFIENRTGMNYLIYGKNGPIGNYLSGRGERLVLAAKRQVGVRSGALRASIHMRHMADSRGQYIKVGSNLHYARVHHDGSRPHTIRPTRAKMLRFESRGQQIFAHLVKHPGTPANRYLTDNLRVFG